MTSKISNRLWLLLLAIIIAISAVLIIIFTRTSGMIVTVYSDNTAIKTVDLSTVTEAFTIKVEFGEGYNIIEFDYGRVRVLHANCPDGTCADQGWLVDSRIPIICLPHRLMIYLHDASDAALDAIIR